MEGRRDDGVHNMAEWSAVRPVSMRVPTSLLEGFPLSLSEWSYTIYPTLYIHK